MKIALVGGAGLIGHTLALRMKSKGHDVLIIDALTVNNKYAVASNPLYTAMIQERMDLLRESDIPLMATDARDYNLLSVILGSFKPDCIVHLAAIAHIDRSNKDPFSTFDHNLRTLENVLDFARGQKTGHVVFFSSSTAYGDFQRPVVDETEPCNPKGIYGSLKYCGELLVKAYMETYSMPCTIIRPCALYGPRCVSGRVTQVFVEKAFKGEPITIFGDPEGRHDFTYIEDLVNGVELVITKEEAKGETFNITGAQARSMKDLANIVKIHFPDLQIDMGPPDPEKPSRGTMSNGKAFSLLGYKPNWTLEKGMAEYIGWYHRFYAVHANLRYSPRSRKAKPKPEALTALR